MARVNLKLLSQLRQGLNLTNAIDTGTYTDVSDIANKYKTAELSGANKPVEYGADEGVNRGSSSTFDISQIRGLSNSILGGPNSFPDGPDTLTIFATNNSQQAGTILGNISWTESQG